MPMSRGDDLAGLGGGARDEGQEIPHFHQRSFQGKETFRELR